MWIRSRYQFEPRSCLLAFTARCLNPVQRQAIDALSAGLPDILEVLLRQMIQGARPDLEGCCIEYFGISYGHNEWEVGVSHQNLPAVPWGEDRPRVRIEINAVADAESVP